MAHVAHDAEAVEVATAADCADVLLEGDLHAAAVVLVPDGAEGDVANAQR